MASEYLCKTCGVPIEGARAIRSGRCPACYPRFCTTCDARLPEGRATRYCAPCLKQQHDRLRSRPGRRCYFCHGPIPATWSNAACPPCNREAIREQQKALAASTTRPCIDCRQPVGDHRVTYRCRDCTRKYRAKLWQKPGRTCAMCGQRIGHRPNSYCKPCQRLYHNWRSAYHRGDPGARTLRPLRSYTPYKAKNP